MDCQDEYLLQECDIKEIEEMDTIESSLKRLTMFANVVLFSFILLPKFPAQLLLADIPSI